VRQAVRDREQPIVRADVEQEPGRASVAHESIQLGGRFARGKMLLDVGLTFSGDQNRGTAFNGEQSAHSSARDVDPRTHRRRGRGVIEAAKRGPPR
jgi:hypothetical protein